jgi:hypothetical protein
MVGCTASPRDHGATTTTGNCGLYHRQRLADNPSTKLDPAADIVVYGMRIIDPKTANEPAFQADGMAFDKDGGWLYYQRGLEVVVPCDCVAFETFQANLYAVTGKGLSQKPRFCLG